MLLDGGSQHHHIQRFQSQLGEEQRLGAHGPRVVPVAGTLFNGPKNEIKAFAPASFAHHIRNDHSSRTSCGMPARICRSGSEKATDWKSSREWVRLSISMPTIWPGSSEASATAKPRVCEIATAGVIPICRVQAPATCGRP